MVLARFRKPALAVTIGAAALALPLSLAVPAEAAAAGDSGGAPASARPGAASVINNPVFAGYQASVAAGSATSSAPTACSPAGLCSACPASGPSPLRAALSTGGPWLAHILPGSSA